MYHSYNFDFSVWEMYGAFLYGGTLVVVPKMTARDPVEFRRLLRDEGVTVLNQTPQAFYQLAEVEEAVSVPDGGGHELAVRMVIFGGEALSPARLKSWKAFYPSCALINMYGITETTVHVTYKEIGDEEIASNLSNIGTVIPTLSSYVMNAGQRLVPIGVSGELCVGGAGVARGYLNRPELSAARFVENPYVPGERLYRSGDLVRRLPSGDMEYLGRIDHQVKIRGFRIELDEIKNRMLAVDGVVDALVLDKTGPSGGKFLAAYYTCRGEVGAALLKDSLHAWLPDYMVPSYFIKLDAFPLTPNGKVDRRRLPDIDAAESTAGEFVEASDDRERTMAQIWKEILKRDRVGAADNFFEIGGDSILAMQVVAKANQAGIFITVRDVFQFQTVRAIVAQAASEAASGAAAFADQGPVTGPSPLTAIQERFFQTTTAAPAYYNQAFLLDVREELDVFALAGALQAVVDHHDVLRSRFVADEDGTLQQEFLPPGTGVSFDLQDLSGLDPESRLKQVYEFGAAAQASFDLSSGPLLKAVLMSFGAAEHRLFIAAHHLIVDGVSWRLIMQDLGGAYGAARAGALTVLPPKTVSYQRWALAARTRAADLARDLEAPSGALSLEHWRAIAAVPVGRIPRDGDGLGRNRYGSARTVSAALDPEETAALLTELPKNQRVAVNEAIAAAVVRAFAAASGTAGSGTDHLRVDLEGHGREQETLGLDVGRTVGWFTAVYPAALDAAPNGDWGELLAAVKEGMRKAAERSFEYGLLAYLAPEGEARRVCRSIEPAELIFNYLGQFASSMEALSANMTMSAEPIAPTSAPENERTHAFEINALVMADRLTLDIIYSSSLHAETTVRGLADRIIGGLRELIAYSRSGGETRYTPSDFAAADLDADDLAAILKNL
jgi:non-ribosomal peptide synthase protein (TIGR01720 family)